MSNVLWSNLRDVEHAAGWAPQEGQLAIERFGLNYDFIVENDLSSIEGLTTGSGEDLASPSHKDHKQAYVQDYLRQYGARKVEANALVTSPAAGRELCRNAILKYVNPDAIGE